MPTGLLKTSYLSMLRVLPEAVAPFYFTRQPKEHEAMQTLEDVDLLQPRVEPLGHTRTCKQGNEQSSV